MPRIIRWFPVTHDINADPEIWELREEFGDRAGFVWLEILSIADRNDGLLGPDSPQLRTVLASKCRVYSPKVHAILDWCLGRGWLEFKDGLRVANYWKYHRTREPKEILTGNSKTPLLPNLSEPTEPNSKEKRKSKSKTDYPDGFDVSEGIRAFALNNKLPDPSLEIDAFRDYHVSNGSRFIDWEAAFRNWLRNARRFNGRSRPSNKVNEMRQSIAETLNRGIKK